MLTEHRGNMRVLGSERVVESELNQWSNKSLALRVNSSWMSRRLRKTGDGGGGCTQTQVILLWPPSPMAASKRVWVLDLDISTVYKSPAPILL
jgi:hypothetical protein